MSPDQTTHRIEFRWDIGPFTLYEAHPIHATQEWRPEEYFVAVASQNTWLRRESYLTLAEAFRAMADYLEKRS
jgi:hypothetical protein